MLSIARQRKRSRSRQLEANTHVVLACTETDGTGWHYAYAQIVALLPEPCLAVMMSDETHAGDHTGQAKTPTQDLWFLSGGLYPRRPGTTARPALWHVQRRLHHGRTAPDRGERPLRPLRAAAPAQTRGADRLARSGRRLRQLPVLSWKL